MSLATIRSSVSRLLEVMQVQNVQPSIEVQNQLAQLLTQAASRIAELRIQEPQVPATPPVPEGADLLWILSGGQPQAFLSYLRTFPDPALNQLLQNPTLLNQTIAHLQETMPQGTAKSPEGIEKAPLNSSNIYGFHYDPKSGVLLVKFQSGSVYGYGNVPKGIFRVFQQGAVPAKTTGQNRFGRWWTGKIPSLGAAFYQLIRQGGYPYEKLR